MFPVYHVFLADVLLLLTVNTGSMAHEKSFAERSKGKPARNICQASLAVAEDAYDEIFKITEGSTVYDDIPLTIENVDHPRVQLYHHNKWKLRAYREFVEQNVPTKVVKMHLPESTRLQAIEDLKRLQDIQKKVDEIVGYHNAQGQAYSPFRIEFDQAVLFVPACLEFMHRNRDLVRHYLPKMHTCQCNAFSVRPHGKPFGFHRASTLGIEFKELFDRGWFFPEFHMSFHTAMNPTNESTSPLVIFDGELPKLFNDGYLLGKFLEEKTWRPDLTKLARRAIMSVSKRLVPIQHTFALLHFAWAVYYAMENCPNEESASIGTYWELEPGEALFFNNWRMHSDHRFGTNDHERHTLDLRCYSKVETPFPFSDERDLLMSILPTVAKMQDAATECLVRLFDYSGEKEFYEFIGFKPKKRLSYALGNTLHNYINAGEEGLLSEMMFERMQMHALNARRMLDEDSLNYTAFDECVRENKEALFAPSGIQGKRINLPHMTASSLLKLAMFGVRVKLGYWGEKFLMFLILLIVYIALLRLSTVSRNKGKME